MTEEMFESDWDLLIILDGCRYDEFEKHYSSYFRGELEKRRSKGSTSCEWAAKTFTGHHDLTYFSANPFINDIDLPLSEIEKGGAYEYNWQPNEYISNIIDVWDFAWNDEIGTVEPGEMNRVVLDNIEEVERSERTIVHYLQPHTPFVDRGRGRIVGGIRESFLKAKYGSGADEGILSGLTKRIAPFIEDSIGDREYYLMLGYLLGLQPRCVLDIIRDGFRETIQEYHQENLKLVMEKAQELAREFDGKIVITADHGDAFGEEGVWAHPIETHIPALVEVPWFEVESAK